MAGLNPSFLTVCIYCSIKNCIQADTLDVLRMVTDTKSSGETAYDALVAALRRGDYVPGDRLREEEVADRLGLSRTPVREALRRLETDRIVEHRPRVGAVIRKLTRTEIVELYDMRSVLERTAAQMATKHGATAEFDALAALNTRIEADRGNPVAAAAYNHDFHLGLYHAARNGFLLDAARALNNSLLLLGPTTYSDPGRIDVVAQEHRVIVNALRAGDGEAAADAAEAHLHTSLVYRLQGTHT